MLKRADCPVTLPRSRNLRWEALPTESADLFVAHHSLLPSPAEESIRELCEAPGHPALVILSDRENPEERAAFLAAGAEAVLNSRLTPEEIMDVIRPILEKRREFVLATQINVSTLDQPSLSDFISKSPSMRHFLGLVRRIIDKDSPVLLLGETGTGKEWLARAIHAESSRAKAPFVAVNCGALPESLLESELFGHEEGAFTGATHSRKGRFELAHRGTIFLDEIGDMPYPLQVKLLRVLQEKEVQRLGSERTIRVDVRIMAATNADLREDVQEKRFRKDLYYRLSVIELELPPLRERVEDIPELAGSYVDYFRSRIGGSAERVSDRAMEALGAYCWPGNVRELVNVIERAMILCESEEVSLEHLPDTIRGRSPIFPTAPSGSNDGGQTGLTAPEDLFDKPLKEARESLYEAFESLYISKVLERSRGRIGEAAEMAGIDPRSLYGKMKRLGLRKESFKRSTDGREAKEREGQDQ